MGSRVLLSVGEDSALLGPTLNIQLPLNKLTMQQLLAEVLLFFFYILHLLLLCALTTQDFGVQTVIIKKL